MKKEIKIPSLGESIVEVKIGELFKKNGSFVTQDEEILEIETDKVNQALYAPATGTLTLHVKKEDLVKINEVIGFVEEQETQEPPSKAPPKEIKEIKTPIRVSIPDFLEEKEIIKEIPLTPSLDKRTKMPKIRQVISERLLEVSRNTAMLTTFNEIDLKKVIELRTLHQERFQKEHGVKLGYMSFFVKASLSALKAYPLIKSFIENDEIVTPFTSSIGIAVSTERGLIVPVLKNAETLSFAEIEQEIASFAKKAKEGGLQPKDLSGGCFTITNGGVFGSLFSTPILNPPQSAILGMHKIQERPVAIDSQVEIRPMMYVALSYDHRLIDGKEAVSFLVHIKKCLEDPTTFLLEL
jgi:2-oxoglutarate dehydrogenase E2 component (dihydrolipoamide succinyltransferase)